MTTSVRFCLSYNCFKWGFSALKVYLLSIENMNGLVTDGIMTLRASNQVWLWHNVIHWLTATSYDKQMYTTPQTGSGAIFENETAHQTCGFQSALFYDTFLFDPMSTNPTHVCSVNNLSISVLMFLVPKMIHLLKWSKMIPHLINASELHSPL